MSKSDRLIIGIDFGTTYSGVAYYLDYGGEWGPRDIKLITRWPGSNGVSEKVPSRLHYSDEGKIQFGHQVKLNSKNVIFSCLKLRLDERTRALIPQMEAVTQGFSREGHPLSEDAVALVGHYLEKLRKVLEEELLTEYGYTILDSVPRDIVVTVPAVWSEAAKQRTLRSVAAARFNGRRVSLVTEPEAAAMWSLKCLEDDPFKATLEVNDTFIICDAGGGTVDLISYKITQKTPTYKMEEAVVGSGDKCGSVFVDQEFLKWLERWIGSERFEKIPPEKRRPDSSLLSAFARSKLAFSADSDSFGTVTLPVACGAGNDRHLQVDEDHVLTITCDQMREIFEPCVERIKQLIQGQVKAIREARQTNPKVLYIVGGFGDNQYLCDQIKNYCSLQNIEVRRPLNPWSAVARGAVCRGLESGLNGMLSFRLARKCYGTMSNLPWEPNKYHPDDYSIVEVTKEAIAKDQMNWLVVKGDQLSEAQPRTITINYHWLVLPSEARQLECVLYGNDTADPPSRWAAGGIYAICTVTVDFNDVPLDDEDRRVSNEGKHFWFVPISFEASFQGAEIIWRCLYKGRERGSISVGFDT